MCWMRGGAARRRGCGSTSSGSRGSARSAGPGRWETNSDGRTDGPVIPKGRSRSGPVELVFHAGAYLDAAGGARREPAVPRPHPDPVRHRGESGRALPRAAAAGGVQLLDVSGELRGGAGRERGDFTREKASKLLKLKRLMFNNFDPVRSELTRPGPTTNPTRNRWLPSLLECAQPERTRRQD